MRNKYILVAPDFKKAQGKWTSGRWATIELPDGTVIAFKEEGEEISVELNPDDKVIFRQGWSHIVDRTVEFIANPDNDRLHQF
jgi:uncharacterized cupin superfamily protein